MPHYFQILFLVFAAAFITHAEKVCKYTFTGVPELLHGKKLVVHDSTVAMGEKVKVDYTSFLEDKYRKCAVMFIIDISASNYNNDPGRDRLKVVSAVIDSMYKLDPHMEVGCVLFGGELYFDPADDNIFARPDNTLAKGGIIPLLVLDSTYTGKNKQGNYKLKGYEIIKNYIKPSFDSNINQMLYKPTNGALADFGTWISIAFDGAIYAFKNTKVPKYKHFIMFFFDGDASMPADNAERYRYVKGINVPTTFSVYYEAQPIPLALDNLKKMTENIKNNGYSSSNPKSNLWSLMMNFNALLKLLMQNVVSEIIKNVFTYTPKKLVVNTITAPSGWINGHFYFNSLFALTRAKTPFTYSIDYEITKDSIVNNNGVIDTIHIKIKDTTHAVSSETEVTSLVNVSDSVKLTWWGRNLEYYYNGSKISVIGETMDKIEIRFTEYKVDTLYGYKNVSVEVANTQTSPPDRETFALNDAGAYYAYTVAIKTGSSVPGDGILQHGETDTIGAVFRNPLLPLDTLRVSIPYSTYYPFALNKAVYFDNNADGHVDSIFLGVTGGKLSDYVNDLVKIIPLPQHRKFELQSYAAGGSGIALRVAEKAQAVLTYVTPEDVIRITDTIKISDKAFLVPCEVPCIDSVAPVIIKACFIDSLKIGARDELTVQLSEDVAAIKDEQPFLYYDSAAKKVYRARLAVLSQTGNTGVFAVQSIDGAPNIQQGDSIRIHAEVVDIVRDILGNKQDNPQNIRREIEVLVVEEGLKIERGIYYDRNADGHIDKLYLTVAGENLESHLDALMKLVILPPFRMFMVNGFTYVPSNGILINALEQNDTVRTNVIPGKDVVIVPEKVILPDGMPVLKANAPIVDSVAPVIMKAWARDSIRVIKKGKTVTVKHSDPELTVLFSEAVDAVKPSRPFRLYRNPGDNEYTAVLQLRRHEQAQEVFLVQSLERVQSILDGDSIRINWSFDKNVCDPVGNNQANPLNIRRTVDVQTILDTIYLPADFTLIFNATLLDAGKQYTVPDDIAGIKEISSVLAGLTAVQKNTFQGIMIMTLEPDSIDNVTTYDRCEATISLYDALGNIIFSNRAMGFDKSRKRLIYIWDGMNSNCRRAGGGEYLAVVYIHYYFNNQKNPRKPSEVQRHFVGVKK